MPDRRTIAEVARTWPAGSSAREFARSAGEGPLRVTLSVPAEAPGPARLAAEWLEGARFARRARAAVGPGGSASFDAPASATTCRVAVSCESPTAATLTVEA